MANPLPPSAPEPRRAAQTAAAPPDPFVLCLMAVGRHFDRPLAEADARAACPIADGGMDLAAFRRAATRLGYKTAAASLDAKAAAVLPTPFLALDAAGAPALMVLRRDGAEAEVFDPASARFARRPVAEIGALARRAVLIKPQGAGRAGWRAGVAARVRGVLWELILASALVNLFALAAPLFVMTVYNKVVGQQALSTLDVLAVGMVTLYAFELALRMIRGYVSSHTGGRLDAALGSEVVHHLVNLPYRSFQASSTGVMGERLRQLDTVRQFFTGQMPMLLADLGFVALFVGALFFISPFAAYLTLGAAPLFILISALAHRRQMALFNDSFEALAAKGSTLAETVANALTVKALGLETEMEKRWEKHLAKGAIAGFRISNLGNMAAASGLVLQQVVGLAIIYFGARLIISGELSIGALIAANLLATRAIAPMRQLAGAWQQLQQVRLAFRRLDEIMEQPAEAAPGRGSGKAVERGEVRFEAVRFRYGDGLPPALDGVSLEVEGGAILGVAGPSGSGKSTIAKLLLGLYRPESGRVLIDGADVSHMSPAVVRRQIAVVPQEVQLFAGTVAENIAMGMERKDPRRIVAAARYVGANDFIERLPNGYDTVLGERGEGLSAGQRQLLCIARALMRNPRILVLDEATSALDPGAEERLMRKLKRSARGRTIILVSHRMAPLTIADKVALVVDGRIEKVGPPLEIVAHLTGRPAAAPRTAAAATTAARTA